MIQFCSAQLAVPLRWQSRRRPSPRLRLRALPSPSYDSTLKPSDLLEKLRLLPRWLVENDTANVSSLNLKNGLLSSAISANIQTNNTAYYRRKMRLRVQQQCIRRLPRRRRLRRQHPRRLVSIFNYFIDNPDSVLPKINFPSTPASTKLFGVASAQTSEAETAAPAAKRTPSEEMEAKFRQLRSNSTATVPPAAGVRSSFSVRRLNQFSSRPIALRYRRRCGSRGRSKKAR